MQNEYTKNVDFEFLSGMGITHVLYQPWQLGLFYPEWEGKFVWYPKNGTLMAEHGEYKNKKIGEYLDTEEMYLAMRKYLQQSRP